jgi:hypothetical protein
MKTYGGVENQLHLFLTSALYKIVISTIKGTKVSRPIAIILLETLFNV